MKNSMVFKVFAFILASVCFFCTIACGAGIAVLALEDLYTQDPDTAMEDWCYSHSYSSAYAAARYYAAVRKDELSEEMYDHLFPTLQINNMVVEIYENGKSVYSVGSLPDNADSVKASYPIAVDYPTFVARLDDLPSFHYDYLYSSKQGDATVYYVFSSKIATFDVTVKLDKEVLLDDGYDFLLTLYDYRYSLIGCLVVFLLLSVLLLVYLLCTAGRDREGNATPVGLSRLPLDLYCAAALLFLLLLVACYDDLFYHMTTVVTIALILATIAICIPIGLGLLYIFSAQLKCKNGYWWKHTVCGWCLLKIYHFFRRCLHGVRAVFDLLPVIWQWLLIAGGMALSLLIAALLTFGNSYIRVSIFFPFLLLVIFACIAVVLYGSWCFGMILSGAQKMSEGELDYRIPEKKLFGAFKTCAQQLNSLSGAAKISAEKQLRSERMKTEVITNVSHDIKTPLTSIINFVDLLEKPHTEEEGAQYLEVLSRQSLSLKKLIEDLMDLSKASTGNMAVNLTTIDIVEAANQAVGEFSDKLDKAQLSPIVRAPKDSIPVLADGRLVWRVLSNLLGNAVKYAAPHTRVYLDVTEDEKTVYLSLRNISREELNVTAEELLERFVQGDASRNTEGSGLGLNIAKSLMEVQHGTLDLTLDGDLFKVALTFPKA